jgi:hypothetical protein
MSAADRSDVVLDEEQTLLSNLQRMREVTETLSADDPRMEEAKKVRGQLEGMVQERLELIDRNLKLERRPLDASPREAWAYQLEADAGHRELLAVSMRIAAALLRLQQLLEKKFGPESGQ